MYKKILVATDGSQLSLKAATQGMDLAKTFSSQLKIVYVIDQRVFFFPHEIQGLTPENPYFSIFEDLRKNAQSVMDSLLKEAEKRGIQFESAIREGAVVDVILDTARAMNADLLVIGAHGETGAERGLPGSTAQALTNSAPCSLLIVKS